MQDFDKFYKIALRFLSYRPRSENEVRDNLKRKNADPSTIDQAILKLKEQGFVNDEEFVRWWVESRLRFRPRSLRLIKLELRQKGILEDLIESGIMNHESGIKSDSKSAISLIEKRIGRYKNLSKQEIYNKLGRFLASKGFDWDTIKQSVDEVLRKEV